MHALYFVLGIPIAGGVVLALTGHRDAARDINVGFSLGTFLVACVLTAQVIEGGPDPCRQGIPVIDTSPGPVQADGTISGTVFADANRNGQQNTGESGLGGYVIFLDTNYNGESFFVRHAYFTGAEKLAHWQRVYRPRSRMRDVALP